MFRSNLLLFLFIKFNFKILYYYFQQKIEGNNKKLEGLFNDRYRKIRKLGEGAQGTVFAVEDTKENNTK